MNTSVSYETPDPLIAQLIAGEPDAIARLYDRDAGWVLALAQRFVDPNAAQDTLRQVFERVQRDAGHGGLPGLSVEGWLIRLTREIAQDKIAQRLAVAVPDHPAPRARAAGTGGIDAALGHLNATELDLLGRAFWRGNADAELVTNGGRRVLRQALSKLEDGLSQRLRTQPESRDGLAAAEHILGTLPAAEDAVFRDRLRQDEALRAVTGEWAEALSHLARPLSQAAAPVELRKALLGGQRRKQMRSLLGELDLLPLIGGLIVSMLLAFGLFWLAQGGLSPTSKVLQADIAARSDQSVLAEAAYSPGDRRLIVRAVTQLDPDVIVAVRIGAEDPVQLGTLDPMPQVTLLTVPDLLPKDLSGVALVLIDGDAETARGVLLEP